MDKDKRGAAASLRLAQSDFRAMRAQDDDPLDRPAVIDEVAVLLRHVAGTIGVQDGDA